MMMSSSVLQATVLLGAALGLFATASPTPVEKRSQCAATLTDAEGHANALQSSYFKTLTGGYTGGELWTDANTLEDLGNLMLAAGTTTWGDDIVDSYISRLALIDLTLSWEAELDGSWDDAQWVILALWKIADYLDTNGGDSSSYLSSAQEIYALVEAQWDDTCGGGVWWSSAHTYKNAITNHLYLYTSAEGYKRYGDSSYLTNAENVWNWLYNSGMRNSQGLWNDGLVLDTCENNGETTWTYNQAVVASGLSALYSITGNDTLLTQAEITLDAAIEYLTEDGILKESCDSATDSTCDDDQTEFKGLFTKHLQYYLDNASSRVSKYSSFLGDQASAVIHYATGSDYATGSVWYAANDGGSLFTPQAADSGLAALIADAKYGPC